MSDVGGTAGRWIERFFRGWATNATIVASVAVVFVGFVVTGGSWSFLGLVVGAVGIGLPWWASEKRWSLAAQWAMFAAVIFVDLVTLVVLLVAA